MNGAGSYSQQVCRFLFGVECFPSITVFKNVFEILCLNSMQIIACKSIDCNISAAFIVPFLIDFSAIVANRLKR